MIGVPETCGVKHPDFLKNLAVDSIPCLYQKLDGRVLRMQVIGCLTQCKLKMLRHTNFSAPKT
jgi:hypothetical protein